MRDSPPLIVGDTFRDLADINLTAGFIRNSMKNEQITVIALAGANFTVDESSPRDRAIFRVFQPGSSTRWIIWPKLLRTFPPVLSRMSVTKALPVSSSKIKHLTGVYQ